MLWGIGGLTWLIVAAFLVVPALIVSVVLIVSHLDAFEASFSSTANVNCPHCGGDTPPRRRVCRHCGGELQ